MQVDVTPPSRGRRRPVGNDPSAEHAIASQLAVDRQETSRRIRLDHTSGPPWDAASGKALIPIAQRKAVTAPSLMLQFTFRRPRHTAAIDAACLGRATGSWDCASPRAICGYNQRRKQSRRPWRPGPCVNYPRGGLSPISKTRAQVKACDPGPGPMVYLAACSHSVVHILRTHLRKAAPDVPSHRHPPKAKDGSRLRIALRTGFAGLDRLQPASRRRDHAWADVHVCPNQLPMVRRATSLRRVDDTSTGWLPDELRAATG